MKKICITISLLLLISNLSFAQNTTHFATSGTIEYNKTSNMFAIVGRMIDKNNESYLRPAYDQFKKTQPQFKVLKSTLKFSNNKTLFTPAEPTDLPVNNFFGSPISDQNNIIYTDIAAGNKTSQKKVFEETFLLKDSVRNIKWKITDETREIAGYTCRRANALILDSIYVVAFYTDKIMVSGGPESFTGLPGMILEVAIPHENIIWLATKVSDISVPESTITPPKKGKVVDNKSFRATLDGAMKSWGTWGQVYYKAFLL